RTSHIPVILLTARTADEQKLEGFEGGANDYISKPFNFEILQARIRNCIVQQDRMRKAMNRKVLEVQPSEIAITSLDEKLIQKAIQTVERAWATPAFQ
ncbi:MAG: response regulator transcription factor, partial [Bacteroidia bacterium]|nr:response regulator transcription factor [Bacteroidia bacterium]